jgi:hypothetical protein
MITSAQSASGSDGLVGGAWWSESSQQQSTSSVEVEDLVNDLSGAAPSASDDNSAQVLSELMDGLQSPNNTLSQLTGADFSTANPPDYLAVVTGSDVTSQYAGGYSNPSWTDDGNNVNFFSTGTPPDAVKGVAITFGPTTTTTAERRQVIDQATQYLQGHASDYQLPGGAWNQPTFDVTV